jgi:hypothetical protein
LSEDVVTQASEIVQREFSSFLFKTKNASLFDEKAMMAVERLMKFMNATSIPLSHDAAKKLRDLFEDKLGNDELHFTNKMLEKESVDVKIEKEKPKRDQQKEKPKRHQHKEKKTENRHKIRIGEER